MLKRVVWMLCLGVLGSALGQEGLPVDVVLPSRADSAQLESDTAGSATVADMLTPPTWEEVCLLGELLEEELDRVERGPITIRTMFVGYLAYLQTGWLELLKLECPSVAQLKHLQELRTAAASIPARIRQDRSDRKPAFAEGRGIALALTAPETSAADRLEERIARLNVVLRLAGPRGYEMPHGSDLARMGRREFQAILDLAETTPARDLCDLGALDRALRELERRR